MANTIKLDLDRTLGTVDRNIFGGFAEHSRPLHLRRRVRTRLASR